MGVMSVRELNADIARALALVEAGETIDITEDGKVIAELRSKKGFNRLTDPEFRAAYERAKRGLEIGVPGLTGPATYEERTGR